LARIAIVGAGAAGNALAVLLVRAGHAVEVFEAVAQPEPIGAGLLLQPSGQQVLARLGLLAAMQVHGALVEELFGDNPAGRTVLALNYRHLGAGQQGLGVQRGALMGLLWQALRDSGAAWHCGTTVQRFEQDERGVILHGEAGALGRFDLLVLANGSFSRLRGQLRVPQRERLFPWGALWCVLPTPAEGAGLQLRQRYRAARQMIGLMPVGHAYAGTATPGADSVPGTTLFWSLPDAALQQWQQAPDLPRLKREMLGLLPLAEPWLQGLQAAQQLRVARYADVWMPHWHDGRVVAIGDCAHGMSPQLGQGANMALVDAWVLAGCIADRGPVPAALQQYSAQRRDHLRFYQQASRWLTPLFQSSQTLGPLLRDLLMGPGGQLPYVREQTAAALGGLKTGWFAGRLTL
jgi:2-polyprenyl-6-methoxyphenol hydroxylase-like FAD-dependent oxidoreductase